MDKKNLICIGCPIGCPLTIEMEDGQIIKVTGNTCPKGVTYAEKEITNPTRIVTSTVQVEGGIVDMLSVKTEKDIPKGKIALCVAQLKGITVKAPVKIGDVIVPNIAGTGVNIIATRDVPKR